MHSMMYAQLQYHGEEFYCLKNNPVLHTLWGKQVPMAKIPPEPKLLGVTTGQLLGYVCLHTHRQWAVIDWVTM